jgi:hypothetical protein
MATASGSTDLPRYWCTLGNYAIWDYLREVDEKATYHLHETDVASISSLLLKLLSTTPAFNIMPQNSAPNT